MRRLCVRVPVCEHHPWQGMPVLGIRHGASCHSWVRRSPQACKVCEILQ